jgi:hypothetical protein
MNDSFGPIERRLASRFREGPSHAPSGLLDAALSSTRRTRQRSELAALLLGTPGAGPRVDSGARGLTRLQLLLVAILAGGLVAGILVAGAIQLLNRAIVIIPTPTSTTPPIVPSTSPIPSSRPLATPEPVADLALGLVLDPGIDAPWSPQEALWGGHEMGLFDNVAQVAYGGCPQACDGDISISSGSPMEGVIVDWIPDCAGFEPQACASFGDPPGGPVRLHGASTDELAGAWVDYFGQADAFARSISSAPVVVLSNGRATGAVFVRQGQAFALTVHARGSSRSDQLARLDRVLQDVHFSGAGPGVYTDGELGFVVSALDTGRWTLVHPGWGFDGGDDNSEAFWFGDCVDNLCSKPSISISSGDPSTGAIVGRDKAGVLLRVKGNSVSALRRAWLALFPESTFEELDLDGRPAVLAADPHAHVALLSIVAGRPFSISAQPPWFGSFALSLEEQVRRFARQLYFPASWPKVTTSAPTPGA